MTHALAITAVAAYALLWLWPVSVLLHKGTDPDRRRPWVCTVGAVLWFLGGLFLGAYVITSAAS